MSKDIDNKEIREELKREGAKNSNSDSENKAKIEAKVEARVEKNISVHEMPKKFRFGSFNYSNSKKVVDNHSKKPKSYSKDKTKKIGMIIMVFGVLIIISLIYLAFTFFVKSPKPTQVTTPPVVEESQEEVVGEEAAAKEEVGDDEPEEVVVEPVEEEKIEELIEEEVVEEEPVVIIVNDSDQDGLSDVEEALLGSSSNDADSDGDGYTDISELSNLYNPAGAGKLLDNPNILEYKNSSFNYSILYPKNWSIISAGGKYSIMFQVGEDSFVQVIAQENIKKEGIRDWYRYQFPLIKNVEIVEGNNWTGIKKDNGLVMYLTDVDNEYIYVLSYTSINEGDESYINIFNAMINSFTINVSKI